MKKIAIVLALLLSIGWLCQCARVTHENGLSSGSNGSTGAAVDDLPTINEALTEEDFIIYYQGFEIGDHIPFEELAEKLGFVCDNKMDYSADNVDVRAAGRDGNISFRWFQAFYPDLESADLVIDFVVDRTEQKAWLVMVDILTDKATTYRGLTVGDSEQDYLEKYGDKHFSTKLGFYIMKYWENEALLYPTKEITVVFDVATKVITKIFVDCNKSSTMNKFNLPSLGD